MTLLDLLPQVGTLTYEDAKSLALVFGQDAYDAITTVHGEMPDARNRVAPVQLTDGRWMLCGDLLTEIHPGGLYAQGFSLLPQEMFAQVEVIPWTDAVALLPVAEEPMS